MKLFESYYGMVIFDINVSLLNILGTISVQVNIMYYLHKWMLLPPPSFLGTSKSIWVESIVCAQIFYSFEKKNSNIGLIFIIYWISAWKRHHIIYWWHFGTETLQPTSNHYFTLANILISSAQTHTRHFPISLWKRQLRKWYVCSSHSGRVTSLVQKNPCTQTAEEKHTYTFPP